MTDDRQFYRVAAHHYDAPTRDYLEHGYEEERDYRAALRHLVERWKKREGEAVDERNGFLRLRFHDTPGGCPDEAWIPRFLLTPIPMPEYAVIHEKTPEEELIEELDRAFGFD